MNRQVKKVLETSLRGLVALSILTALAVASARAQNREEHFISARAGGVNFVSGDVRARRAGEADWQRLTAKDDLQAGDTVRTGAGGRAEVLLNPGSYFRAGESTEFELVDSALDDLRLRLTRGAAVVEATGYDRLGLDITVATPQTQVHIVRAGLYRLGVLPSGVTEVAVEKGRLLVGDGQQVVKGGQVVRVGAGGVEVAKLGKRERDDLDQWSRDRGKELAKLNDKLVGQKVAAVMYGGVFRNIYPATYGSGGVWAFNSSFGCYTFLPFFYGWYSPYGYGYNSYYAPYSYTGTYGGGYTGGYHPGGGNTNPPGHTRGGSPGGNRNPVGYTPRPSPPPSRTPARLPRSH
jgi:hypothetical protein